MICKHILLMIFLDKPELNGLKVFYLIQILLLTINHLFAQG